MSADNDKKKRWAEETGEEPGSQTQAWLRGASDGAPAAPAPEAPQAPAEAPEAPQAQETSWDEQGELSQLTVGQRLLMMGVLVLGLLGAALPLMLASWGVLAVMLLAGLERMDSVALASLGESLSGRGKLLTIGLAMALSMIPSALLKPLHERASSRAAMVSIAYLIMMAIFYAADGKLPPFLFHALALVSGFGLLLALPWAVTASLIGFCHDTWRWLERNAFWAGAATMGGAAAVGAVIAGWLAFGAEVMDKIEAQPTAAAMMQSPPVGDAEGDIMSAFGVPALDAETSPLFHACVDELHAPRAYEGSWRDQALRILQRRAPGVEEDIVQTALIKVCLRHQREPVSELGLYYIKSVNNLASKNWQKNKHFESCPSFESIDYSYDPDITSFIHASHVLCKLDDEQRQIIVWLAHGFKYPEIAAQLGISHAAARQRGSRAVSRARELMTD